VDVKEPDSDAEFMYDVWPHRVTDWWRDLIASHESPVILEAITDDIESTWNDTCLIYV
jgi:hypothetical protein